jgi:hypothetical protein
VTDNILERYRDASLRVYVVWVRRWATDARSEIDGCGLLDPRVVHFWDSGEIIGQPFLDRFCLDFGGLDYDFFLLFDRDASWGASPPHPVSSGATVVAESDRLGEGAALLLRSSANHDRGRDQGLRCEDEAHGAGGQAHSGVGGRRPGARDPRSGSRSMSRPGKAERTKALSTHHRERGTSLPMPLVPAREQAYPPRPAVPQHPANTVKGYADHPHGPVRHPAAARLDLRMVQLQDRGGLLA